MNDLIIRSIRSGEIENNTYLVYRTGCKSGIVIDPSHGTELIIKAIKDAGLDQIAIFLTHGHFDHAESAAALQRLFLAKVYIHALDADKLLSRTKSYAVMTNKSVFETLTADVLLADNDILDMFDMSIKCIMTPGHSKGSCVYVIENNIFAGDTLFFRSYGRYDFFDGNFDQLYNSIVNVIFALEGDYIVHCGHGKSTTLNYERTHNCILSDYTL